MVIVMAARLKSIIKVNSLRVLIVSILISALSLSFCYFAFFSKNNPLAFEKRTDSALYFVGFNFDSSLVAAIGSGTKFYVWETSTGNLQKALEVRDAGQFIFHPLRNEVALIRSRDRVTVWDLTENVSKCDFLLTKEISNSDSLISIAYNPSGSLLAIGSENGMIIILEARSCHLHHYWVAYRDLNLIDNDVQFIGFSPDGTILATSGSIAKLPLKLWNTSGWNLLTTLTTKTNHPAQWVFDAQNHVLTIEPIAAVQSSWDVWSLQGQLVAENTQIIVIEEDIHLNYEVALEKVGALLAFGETFSDSGFYSNINPVEKWLLGVDYRPKIYVFQRDAMQPLAILSGHTDNISDMEFSSDSKWLASVSHDGALRLWSVDAMLAESQK
jgi:WD40 repeat protein